MGFTFEIKTQTGGIHHRVGVSSSDWTLTGSSGFWLLSCRGSSGRWSRRIRVNSLMNTASPSLAHTATWKMKTESQASRKSRQALHTAGSELRTCTQLSFFIPHTATSGNSDILSLMKKILTSCFKSDWRSGKWSMGSTVVKHMKRQRQSDTLYCVRAQWCNVIHTIVFPPDRTISPLRSGETVTVGNEKEICSKKKFCFCLQSHNVLSALLFFPSFWFVLSTAHPSWWGESLWALEEFRA